MSLFRSSPTRIYYGENRTAVSYDIVVVGTAVAAGMLGIAWLCIGPTCKRKRNTILVNLGYAFAVYIFVVSIRKDNKPHNALLRATIRGEISNLESL